MSGASLTCDNIIWESLYINPKLFVHYYETFAQRYKAQLDQVSDELTDMDTTVMAYFLMGVSNFIGLKYVFFDKHADLDHVVDEVMKLLEHGLLEAGERITGITLMTWRGSGRNLHVALSRPNRYNKQEIDQPTRSAISEVFFICRICIWGSRCMSFPCWRSRRMF